MIGIFEVALKVPFRLLISKYGSKPHRLLKWKYLSHLTPKAGSVILTEVISCEIIGIEEMVDDLDDRTSRFTMGKEASLTITDKNYTWEEKKVDPLEDLEDEKLRNRTEDGYVTF